MELIVYLYITVGLFALMVGSFSNVCILRIPLKETVVTTPSHCTSCNKRLHWYELIPLFSYIFLLGKCSKCKAHISLQYPLIEGCTVLLWLLNVTILGFNLHALLACLLSSALLILSVIDARTREIPFSISVFIAVIGAIRLFANLDNWQQHLLGFAVVSGVLFLLLILSAGRAIGGGDVKMMAGCGLFLGLGSSLLAFFLACLVGSVIHIIRMKFFGAKRDLAMGPYLALGVYISMLWGEPIVNWYLNFFSAL